MKTFIFANCKQGKRSLTPDPWTPPTPLRGERSVEREAWSVKSGAWSVASGWWLKLMPF